MSGRGDGPADEAGRDRPAAPRLPRALRAVLAAAALAAFGAYALGAPAAPPGEAAYPHGAFEGDCSECHGDEGWKPARISRRFDHRKRTGFPLAGAHAAVSCTGCHATLDFTRQEKACVSCHADPHLGEMGTDCSACHTPRSFLDRAAMVRRHQLTRFPLVGGHAGLDCEGCHPPTAQGHLRFVGADPACRSCHEPGTEPDHRGFPDDCARCHGPVGWQPARFDHAGTGFALGCAHRALPCARCHGAPWDHGLAADCVSCHQADYAATTSPPHAATGFPTTCASCHGARACDWSGATFDHPFPIAAGRHAGIACATCHTVPGDYARFSCFTGCHAQGETDGHHTEVAGYRYDSAACYSCHPRGVAGD